jgi:hypothetical protein
VVLSMPVKVELEGYLDAEEDIKPPGILHNKGFEMESNPIPSVVGFVGGG